MNAVKPNAVLLKHEDYTPYQFIEKVGRICYKSEDLIAEGTDEKFVKMLLGNNHLAMLEHEFCYFVVHNEAFKDHNIWTTKLYDMVTKEKYLNWAYIADEKQKDALFISGSFRAFIECYSKLVKYMAHPLKDTYPLLFANLQMKIEGKAHNKYNVCKMLTREEFIKEAEAYPNHPEIFQKCLPHTMLFTEDRGVTHEQVRHRPVSYAQESTRYVNYSRGKYGSEITVISPSFFEGEDKKELYQEWEAAMNDAEKHYLKLIEMGAVAQEARTVLPQSTKADIVVTATEEEWRHILNLRLFGTTGKPHPQMKEVMEIAYPQLMKEIRGYDEESIKYKK